MAVSIWEFPNVNRPAGMDELPSVFILRDLLSLAVADWWSVTCNPIPESFGTDLRRWIYEEDFNFSRSDVPVSGSGQRPIVGSGIASSAN
jgi:hypothetical protein